MVSQDPPYNPSPAPAPQTAPVPVASPPPPDYASHDPNGPPKPEAAYQAHPQPGYTQQPTYVTTLGRLNDQPELVDCPFCNRQAMTRVAKEDSSMTMIAGGLLCLVCICLTCLPCMLGWCQNVDHYCSKCGKQLTHKPHDGTVQITEGAREAQNRLGLVDGQQRGPAPGQVPSAYSAPPAAPQPHALPNEYGSQQQQQAFPPPHMQPQHTGSTEMPISEAPQSPPPTHQEKA